MVDYAPRRPAQTEREKYNIVIGDLEHAIEDLEFLACTHARERELRGLAEDYIRQARLFLLDARRIQTERSHEAL